MTARRGIAWTLALLPPLIYVGSFAAAVANQGYVIFGRTDLLVLLACLAYLLLMPWAMARRDRAARFLLATYTLAAGLLLTEWLVPPFVMPKPLVANYPWPPMQYVRKPAAEVSKSTDKITFSVNRFGVRGPDQDPADADLALLCVGGSTTECLYNSDEASWPWRLQELLRDRTDKKVVVGNAGRSGHIAQNHAHLIRHYDATERFDWVLVMCGINDVGAFLRRDRQERIARVPDETLYVWNRPHEAYYRRLGLWRVTETILDVGTPLARGQVFQDATGDWYQSARKARRDALAMRTFDEPPEDLDLALETFRQDLLDILQAARERGRNVAFITQPTLWRDDLTQDLQDKLWQHTPFGAYTAAALQAIMQKFNQTTIDFCREHNVPCIDLAEMLPRDETVFYDDCHFHDDGCAMVAERLAESLCDQIKEFGNP